jgi:hypothetical protein
MVALEVMPPPPTVRAAAVALIRAVLARIRR